MPVTSIGKDAPGIPSELRTPDKLRAGSGARISQDHRRLEADAIAQSQAIASDRLDRLSSDTSRALAARCVQWRQDVMAQ